MTKEHSDAQHAFKALKWDERIKPDAIAEVVQDQSFEVEQQQLDPQGWRFITPSIQRLLEKIRRAGQPLGRYVDGRFYRGILTGLNDAFVVDRATRDRLIAEHASSAELLKPFLRGRDVKRWNAEFADQYLIKIESSENKLHAWSNKPPEEAELIFQEHYPAIYSWFNQYRQKLIKRYDQGKYFWELRACAYWHEFDRPKIIYQEINRTDVYGYDDQGFYSNNKTFIIPDAPLFLLAIFNSNVARWFIHTYSGVPIGGFLALQTPIMSALPIASSPSARLEALVQNILDAKRTNPEADISAWEDEINQRVYALYGLRSDEIREIEAALTPNPLSRDAGEGASEGDGEDED